MYSVYNQSIYADIDGFGIDDEGTGIWPIVGIIECNEEIQEYFAATDPDNVISHHWKLSLTSSADITFSSCGSDYDTRLWIKDANGDRISTGVCPQGDDCGNCKVSDLGLTETFTMTLSAGSYFIEIRPRDKIYSGVYQLSVSSSNCVTSTSILPTSDPTPYPIDTLNPTSDPTPTPIITTTEAPKLSCGPSTYCYAAYIYPLIGTETRRTINIYNGYEGATYFDVQFSVIGNDCNYPSITFEYEEIDQNDAATEYIDVYDDDGSLIKKCNDGGQGLCGSFIECFEPSQALSVDTITNGNSYTVSVFVSSGVNPNLGTCQGTHSLVINAELTIVCSADTFNPTKAPTTEIPTRTPTKQPTPSPSNSPTPAPTTNPTLYPTPSPTTNPIKAPTFSPTARPSPAPTNKPTPIPTPDQSVACGAHNFCYYVDLYPMIGAETSLTVNIANTDSGMQSNSTVIATIHDHHCVNPSISFVFEEIDFNLPSEYITLYDDDGSFIKKCRGANDYCSNWVTCLTQRALNVDKIKKGETYEIMLFESNGLQNFCEAHDYSTNAQLTIHCSEDTASPTYEPTHDPTIDPTVNPTPAPSESPTQSPSFAPTLPSVSPTISPSEGTYSPTNAPSESPTNAPTESPTFTKLQIDNQNEPTSAPTVQDVVATQEKEENEIGDDGANNVESNGFILSDLFDGDSYFILIMFAIALLLFCCCIFLFIFYARKKYKRSKSKIEPKQLTQTHIAPPMVQMEKVTSMSGSSLMGILTNAESPRLSSGMTPSGLGFDMAQRESLQPTHSRMVSYASIASDMNIVQGMITPNGDDDDNVDIDDGGDDDDDVAMEAGIYDEVPVVGDGDVMVMTPMTPNGDGHDLIPALPSPNNITNDDELEDEGIYDEADETPDGSEVDEEDMTPGASENDEESDPFNELYHKPNNDDNDNDDIETQGVTPLTDGQNDDDKTNGYLD